MDSIDEKILSELSLDSRETFSKLSKKIQISREVLQYRIKNLEKNVIKRYSSQINISKLEFQRAGCYIILQNSNMEFQKKIIEFLIKHNYINGISINIGKYDLICDIFYKNSNKLKKVLEEIENFIGEKTKEIFIITIPIEPKFFFNRLLEQKKIEIQKKEKKYTQLDITDLKILELLNKNSRTSIIEIGTTLNVKPNTVAYRIKNLKKNIIEQSTIFINYDTLNIDFYNIQIKISKSKIHKEVSKFLKKEKMIIYYYHYFANKDWDFDLGLKIKEKTDLKEIIQKLKENFGEYLTIKEIYIVEKIFKEELPKGIFNLN